MLGGYFIYECLLKINVVLINSFGVKAFLLLKLNVIVISAETPVSVDTVAIHDTTPSDSAAPVSVEVTTPDGKPGVVREDDKAPTFVQCLQDTEVSLS